ncbi:outer membrane beta-barrel protein [Albibacterium profundi]|uniref:Outer membrane beta-barrel protein n=1 Tax=Albibacterium profundi TaxID=3134906 RepID=A0ABV5CF43_9SPHI
MRFSICFFLISLSFLSYGQQTRSVSGTVQDTANVNLDGVTVRLVSVSDTLTTTTDADGTFYFDRVTSSEFRLVFSLFGFQLQDNFYRVNPLYLTNQLITVILQPQRNILKEVVVFAVPIEIRGDTVQYNAAAYQYGEGALLEELLKKLQGVEVKRSGRVVAHGVPVSRIKVNNKEFFGGDVLTATRNLPAEIIENVQIIDDYGDQANFTGIKNSSPEKIINITIKEDRNRGMFGQVTTGLGTDHRYIGSVSANSFDNDKQLSVLGSVNNTNASLFSFGDITGAGGRESSSSDLSSMIEMDDGINRTNSVGMNFRNTLSEKITMYGGYVFVNRTNETYGTTDITSNFQSGAIVSEETSNLHSVNDRHSLTWNVESKLSDRTYLKISPTLTYQTNDGDSDGVSTVENGLLTTSGQISSIDESFTPRGELDMFFNHRFKKEGRRFSMTVHGDLSEDDKENSVSEYNVHIDSSYAAPLRRIERYSQSLFNDRDVKNFSLRASYIEPIGEKSLIEINYEHTYASYKNSRKTFNIGSFGANTPVSDSTILDYAYQYQLNRAGFNFQYNDDRTTYTIGFGLQPTRLVGYYTHSPDTATNKNYLNFVPSLRVAYKINKFSNFSIHYQGRNNQPDFAQIQPVQDRTNSQNIIFGNPLLKSEFINQLSLQYRSFALKSGNSFFSSLTFQNIKDKIVVNRVSVPNTTKQWTSYQNTSGYFDANAYYLYSLSLIEEVLNVNFSGSAIYTNNISYINFQKNKGRYLVYTQGLQASVMQDDWLDIDFRGSYTLNHTSNSLVSLHDNVASTWMFGVGGKTYFGKWAFSFDISQRVNNGYSDFINANPTLLNAYFERTFLKNNRGAIRIQAYDLFNQNTGFSHDVYGNETYQTRNNRLGRYFLVSLNFRLQKFPDLK